MKVSEVNIDGANGVNWVPARTIQGTVGTLGALCLYTYHPDSWLNSTRRPVPHTNTLKGLHFLELFSFLLHIFLYATIKTTDQMQSKIQTFC